MRVIKFRVWDCELKEMIYDAQDESGYESDGFTDFLHRESRYKVMQFTGLLDKSGKEILEGDIVRCRGLFTIETVVVKDIRNIPVQIRSWPTAYGKGNGDCEVLGNIYENAELLHQIKER